MPTGHISYFNGIKHFGFIDSIDTEYDHLFFHKSHCNKSYKNIHDGDKVSFELIENGPNGLEIADIRFIGNCSLDGLRSDYVKQTTLKGYLKKINEHYYVKDKETYIFIRLFISDNEINLKENYEDKLNHLVEYRILSITSKNKIRAINANRAFLPECYLMQEKKPIIGEVTSKEKGGYKIKVFNTIIGFIPNSFVLKAKAELLLHEKISVTWIKNSENFNSFVFDLTENIQAVNNKGNSKILQQESIKIGDSILGEIKSTTSYGVFITLGYIDGLIHISGIIDDYQKDNDEISNNQYKEILSEIFIKGMRIQVVVEGIQEEKYSLDLDKLNQQNKKLSDEINAKFGILLKSIEDKKAKTHQLTKNI